MRDVESALWSEIPRPAGIASGGARPKPRQGGAKGDNKTMILNSSILPQKTARMFDLLSHTEFIRNFYLSGGTGLALQLKHRESEDLDFFSRREFVPESIQSQVVKLGKLANVILDKGTLNCVLHGVKLQFLHYPYKLLEKPLTYHNLSISSLLDIACTKLITISSRGNKRDFIDLYFILEHYTLPQLFSALKKKYVAVEYNEVHILKSFVYFTDADKQPMPRMLISVQWKEVKRRTQQVVRESRIL